MSNEVKNSAVTLGQSEMEKRVTALRRQTYDNLSILPDHATDNVEPGKYRVKLTSYRDSLEDGGLQVVVQWYFHIRLGFGQIGADGFTISKDGTTRDLEEKELYDFM